MLQFPFVLLLLSLGKSRGDDCACATGNVNARSGAGTNHGIIAVMSVGSCASYKNNTQHTGGLDWANINFNGQNAWVATNWLSITPNECACATGNVHARSGAGTNHSILGILAPGQCVPFKCQKTSVAGMVWSHVEFENENAWVASNWLSFKACSNDHSSHVTMATQHGCPRIITRTEWNAKPPARQFSHFTHIPNHVYVHHGASPPCYTQSACASEVRAYQNYHINGHGWPDIGYSFVIGEDGNVYEANGWDIVGAHTYGHNHDGIGITVLSNNVLIDSYRCNAIITWGSPYSYFHIFAGICIIGNFEERAPNAAALTALKQLIQCGINLRKLPSNYVLEGHCDVRQTSCPGAKLLDVIKTWTHYQRPSTSHCPV